MFLPQHWSQETNNGSKKGTWSATFDKSVVLQGGNNVYSCKVPLDPTTNIACIQSAPGMKRFQAFMAALEDTTGFKEPVCFQMNVVHNDQGTDELINVDLPFDFNENAELSWLA